MPYRGIPSKGCQTCRKRKIRCDQRPGTCLNCEKANRECGGYRNAVDMMFLDETEDVARKMKSELTFDFASDPVGTASPSRPMPIKPSAIPEQSPPLDSYLDIPSTLESQATAFFYTHFVLSSPYFESSSLFTGLSPVAPLPSLRALYHSMVALGLASMAIHTPTTPDMSLSAYAEAQYVAAISALNLSVSSPVESKSDQTLLAVMILTIFETFNLPASKLSQTTQSRVTSLTAWSNHISGAAALLEARGVGQFETHDGVRLFVQAAIPLCVNCMQQGRPIPDIIPSLVAEAKARNIAPVSLLPHSPWRSFELVIRFTGFIGRVRQRQITDLAQLLEIATDMDNEAKDVASNLVGHDRYRTVTSVSSIDANDDILHLGYCHAYSSFLVAETSNGIRSFRLQLNGLIRSVLLIGMTRRPALFTDYEHLVLLQQATNNLRSLSDEIVASVPQYLGYIPVQTTPAPRLTPESDGATPTSSASNDGTSKPRFLWSYFPSPPPSEVGSLPLVRSAGGCHLPWALMTVASTDVATEETQEWVAKWLDQIARQYHIQQATALAKRVSERSWVEGWWRCVSPRDGKGCQPPAEAEGGPGTQLD